MVRALPAGHLQRGPPQLTPSGLSPCLGFFRFDPADVKYLETAQIELCPHECTIGADIRIVGNDSGEKLSILPGVIARKDREAPQYSGPYQDANTFYVAAASNTSGGSSGSPVLNVRGHAVAINAGGSTSSASAFYLPLERVLRALRLIQAGVQVPRGTLGAHLSHKPFDEVRRLGLKEGTETAVRAANQKETGMLCVHHTPPGTFADGVLQSGDVLVGLNGDPATQAAPFVTHFQAVEEAADNAVAVVHSVVGAAASIAVAHGMPAHRVAAACRRASQAAWRGPGPAPAWYRPAHFTCEVGVDGEQTTHPAAFAQLEGAPDGLGTLPDTPLANATRSSASDASLKPLATAHAVLPAGFLDKLHAALAAATPPAPEHPQEGLQGGPLLPAPAGDAQAAPAQALTGYLQEPVVAGQFSAHRRLICPAQLGSVACASFHGSVPLAPALLESVAAVDQAAGAVLEAVAGTAAHSLPAALEALLEAATAVQPVLEVHIQRGGEGMVLQVPVHNEHLFVPWKLLSLSGAALHELSWQTARAYNVAPTGVLVSSDGYMLSRSHIYALNIIIGMAGKPARDVEELVGVVAQLHDGARVPMRFCPLGTFREYTKVVTMDRHWTNPEVLTRNDVTGEWTRQTLPEAPPAPIVEAGSLMVKYLSPLSASAAGEELVLPPAGSPELTAFVQDSLVRVDCDHCYSVDALYASSFMGTGVVVDNQRGLIAVDRDTVCNAVGDIQVTVGGSVKLDAVVAFLHPTMNVALVAADFSALSQPPPTCPLTPQRPPAGSSVTFIGQSLEGDLLQHSATVTRPVQPLNLLCSTTPHFVAYNESTIGGDKVVQSLGGVYLDGHGRACGMLARYAFDRTPSSAKVTSMDGGLAMQNVLVALRAVQAGSPPRLIKQPGQPLPEASLPAMGVEWRLEPFADVRAGLGLPVEWVQRMEEASTGSRQVLTVSRIMPGCPAGDVLQPGDVLLAIGDRTPTFFEEVEAACIAAGTSLDVTVLRSGEVLGLAVPLATMSGRETQRLVQFQGTMLQVAHWSVFLRGFVPATGPLTPYISRWSLGSPAQKHGVRATNWILAVNGHATPTLDAFLAAVGTLQHGSTARLALTSLQGKQTMVSMKLDLGYFPTTQLQLQPDGSWSAEELTV